MASPLALAPLLERLAESDAERCDRLAWYIVKIIMSAEGVKEACYRGVENAECRGQLHRFITILKEVEERLQLKGELKHVAEAAMSYARKPSKEAKIEFNMALKTFVRRVLLAVATLRRCP